MLCALVAALPAAYALTFFRIRRRGLWLTLILIASMLPPISLLVPLYLFWRDLQQLDTYTCLIITYAALQIPFATWMLRGFLRRSPTR